MTDELKDCPFCGVDQDSGGVNVWADDKEGTFCVGCEACGASNLPVGNRQEAIEHWNTRVGERVLAAENDMLFQRAAERLAEIYSLRDENRKLRNQLALLQLSNPVRNQR
jgi:hypothetical protein